MLVLPTAEVQTAAADVIQTAWLAVTVDGLPQDEVLVLRRAGEVFVPAEALRRWGIRVDELPIVQLNNQPYIALGGEELAFTVQESTQTLVLTVAPIRLQTTAVRLQRAPLGRMARSGLGGFVNYDVLAERSYGRSSASALVETTVFSPQGSGTSTFIARSSGPGNHLVRLDTSWTMDDPDQLRSLRIGDSISRGGIGGTPFRFGGIQFGRSFEIQPGFVTLPLPSLGGDAALPSVADIYVNNVLSGHQDIHPGPFTINNVPVVSGSGQVSLIVRDVLGRQTTVSQSYYTSPELLRAGLDDYSVEAGFARRNFARRSFDYGPFFVAGTYRYGISNTFTAETHAEVTGKIQQAGVAANAVLSGVALLSLGVAASHSPAGTGTMVTAGIERSAPRLSYGVIGQLMSDSFVTYGTPRRSPRRSVMAFVGLPVRFGSIGTSYTMRSYRALPSLHIASANATIRLTRSVTLSLVGSKTWGAVADTTMQLLLIMPLGRRTSATAGVSARGDGEAATASVQRNLPTGSGVGYRFSGEAGAYDRLDGQVALQTGFGTYTAEGSFTDQGSAARVSASGSVGVVDGKVFAARQLTQSFAAVRVGDYSGVGVYVDNQLIGRTGRDGLVIVPNLRTFDDNAIRIETDDLPMTAQLITDKQTVRPPRRAGVAVRFDVKGSRDALLTVRLEDGSVLPTGSRVLVGNGDETVSAAGGEVYLMALNDRNTVLVHLENGTCSFELELSADSGPQPRLGPFTCVRPRA
jgi:outer membrane usher protein